MGQTLTHGVYLPNEGERNCYSGLASNWRLLDGAIGTIAAHTTAIAGKADISHTHGNITNDGKVGTDANKPLITGTGGAITAGAFGNQANTFCEGNDSRLSDARTPVAHTHGKSDVTDLFNSANTWSGDNKYTSGFILSNISWSGVTPPSSTKPTVIEFKNSDTRQGRYINRISSTSSETWIETIRNIDANTSYNHTVILKVDNSGNKSVYPSSNNDIDLGIAANQWNNLYAKNYFYNGTAWGLDKANVWSAWQTIERTNSESLLRLRRTDLQIGEAASNQNIGTLTFADSDDLNFGLIGSRDFSGGDTQLILVSRQKYDANNNRSTNGTQKETRVELGINTPSNKYFRPNSNGDVNLGTSTNKWKSLNGVNPGALSLPNVRAAVADPVDTNNWNLTGSRNTYTPTENGWFFIRVAGTDGCSVNVHSGSSSNEYPTWFNSSTGGYATLVVPVEKSITLYIYITATSIEYCSFRPCIGNV